MTSVVFFANGFGDAIINRPALAAVAECLPHPVHLVCNSGPHDFIFRNLGFDSIFALPMKVERIGRSFDLEAVAARVGRCDVFVDMVPWSSELVQQLARRLQASKTIGFATEYDHIICRNTAKNAVELAFDVPLLIDPTLRLKNYRHIPSFSRQAGKAVEQLQAWKRGAGYHRLLAVQSDTFPHKIWSAEGFRRVMSATLEAHPDLACVVVGNQPPPLVMEEFEARIVVLDSFSLEAAMAVVGSSDAFLGIDSCMLHMADLAGVPGVGLFGPATDPTEWGYYWTKASHFRFRSRDDLSIVDDVVVGLAGCLDEIGNGIH